MDGSKIRESLALMDERGNGEGAGYVASGIIRISSSIMRSTFFSIFLPKTNPCSMPSWRSTGEIVHDEEIPTYASRIRKAHTPWRYFFKPDPHLAQSGGMSADDIVTSIVMRVNTAGNGTLIFSSGKNLGVFKASG